MSTEFYLVAAAIVTVLSAARLTRLAVADDFPPVKFFRDRIYDFLDKGEIRRQWQIITWCGYCAAFWLTLIVVAWADLSGIFDGPKAHLPLWAQAWWFFNGAIGGSYLASLIVVNDKEETGAES